VCQKQRKPCQDDSSYSTSTVSIQATNHEAEGLCIQQSIYAYIFVSIIYHYTVYYTTIISYKYYTYIIYIYVRLYSVISHIYIPGTVMYCRYDWSNSSIMSPCHAWARCTEVLKSKWHGYQKHSLKHKLSQGQRRSTTSNPWRCQCYQSLPRCILNTHLLALFSQVSVILTNTFDMVDHGRPW